VVARLSLGPKVPGTSPTGGIRFLRVIKILSMASFRGEVKHLVPCHSFTACKRTLHVWKIYSIGKIERPTFLLSLPALLLDVLTGIIARELWWADWERFEIVWRAVDQLPCSELVTWPGSPATWSRNLTMRRLLCHCCSGSGGSSSSNSIALAMFETVLAL
jgi:hypothetical protein